jgi:hypothetical protein
MTCFSYPSALVLVSGTLLRGPVEANRSLRSYISTRRCSRLVNGAFSTDRLWLCAESRLAQVRHHTSSRLERSFYQTRHLRWRTDGVLSLEQRI